MKINIPQYLRAEVRDSQGNEDRPIDVYIGETVVYTAMVSSWYDEEDTVEVFRVENDRGLGPYSSNWEYEWTMGQEHNRSSHTPHPIYDGIDPWLPDLRSSLFFGFESMEDLEAWFEGWLGRVLRYGHRIVSYTVPREDVIFGGHQVAFMRDRAVMS